MTDKEKTNETIGETINEIADSIGGAIIDIIEEIGKVLTPETTDAEHAKEAEKNSIQETESSAAEPDQRVGYAANLPQAEELEEENIIESDDKTEIEAAISAARETQSAAVEPDELVAESLPPLPSVNRVKLQLQSPNRIHLYWSLSQNPLDTLYRAFGSRAGNYTLVTRLVNLNSDAESFAPAELRGDWWYNVRSNSSYRVDLGFYANNRPFIRLMSSNIVKTPRTAPSPRTDTAADWIVSNKEFRQVLTASGYSHDVFRAAGNTENDLSDNSQIDVTVAVINRFAVLEEENINLAELRWLLVSLAAGIPFEKLRQSLSPEIVKWLENILAENPLALSAANVRGVLESVFGGAYVEMFTDAEAATWERLAPVAVGGSAIHFPEILFPQIHLPDLKAAEQFPADNFGDENEADYENSPSSAEFVSVSSSEFILNKR